MEMNDAPKAKPRKFTLGRCLRWFGLLLCGVYIIFCMFFYANQEWLFIEANVDPTNYKEEKDLKYSRDEFISPETDDSSSPSVKINYQKFDTPVRPVKGVIFYLHGNKGNLYKCRSDIKPFLAAGYDVWTMDYRGFGESTGEDTLNEAVLLSDAELVYNAVLTREGLDAKDTIVWGRSFGSGIAASIAANHSPQALVLETPYWSLMDTVRGKYPFVPPFLFRYELPTHKFLAKVTCPVHLIHGTNDEKIDIDSSERLEVLCEELGLNVVGHPILGAQHNVRVDREFDSELKRILP